VERKKKKEHKIKIIPLILLFPPQRYFWQWCFSSYLCAKSHYIIWFRRWNNWKYHLWI